MYALKHSYFIFLCLVAALIIRNHLTFEDSLACSYTSDFDTSLLHCQLAVFDSDDKVFEIHDLFHDVDRYFCNDLPNYRSLHG